MFMNEQNGLWECEADHCVTSRPEWTVVRVSNLGRFSLDDGVRNPVLLPTISLPVDKKIV